MTITDVIINNAIMTNLFLSSNILTDPMTFILLGMVVLLGFMMVMSAKRRRRTHEQITKMHDELRVGHRIRTVGGVVGRIKEIREESKELKTVLIQTGSDKYPAYMLFDIQAVYGVIAEEGHTLEGAPVPKAQANETDLTADIDARDYVEKRNAMSKKK